MAKPLRTLTHLRINTHKSFIIKYFATFFSADIQNFGPCYAYASLNNTTTFQPAISSKITMKTTRQKGCRWFVTPAVTYSCWDRFAPLCGVALCRAGRRRWTGRSICMAGTQLGTLVTYNPWSVGPTALLDDIAARFEEFRVHHVPVVDGQRRVIGMLSETDLLRARQSRRAVLVAAGGHDTDDAPAVFARDCMSREVHTIAPTAEFAAALSLLLDRQIHALPVAESA